MTPPRSSPAAPPRRLSAVTTAEGEASVITLRGRAGDDALPLVVDAMAGAIAECDGAVVIDATALDAIDAACLRAITLAAHYLSDTGRELTVRAAPGSRLLAIVDGPTAASTAPEP